MGSAGTGLQLLSLAGFPELARIWPELGSFEPDVVEQLEIDAQYAGYLDRQDADIIAFRRDEGRVLPDSLDYGAVIGLSNEVRQKLERIRPATSGPGRPHRRGDGGCPHPGSGPCEGCSEGQKCLKSHLNPALAPKNLPPKRVFHVKHWRG